MANVVNIGLFGLLEREIEMDSKLYTSECNIGVAVTTHVHSGQTSVEYMQYNPFKACLWLTNFIIDPGKQEDATPFNHNVHHLILQCTQTTFNYIQLYIAIHLLGPDLR